MRGEELPEIFAGFAGVWSVPGLRACGARGRAVGWIGREGLSGMIHDGKAS
jgi:hypothetical protein